MYSEGELIIDHRASPGISEAMALKSGLPPQYMGEGSLFETATLWCCHCSGVQLKNVNRTRPRYSCAQCGVRYICDICAAATLQPQYVHRSFEQLADMVRSGRWAISGPSSAPVMIEVTHNG